VRRKRKKEKERVRFREKGGNEGEMRVVLSEIKVTHKAAEKGIPHDDRRKERRRDQGGMTKRML
jgi:hypothetical protein